MQLGEEVEFFGGGGEGWVGGAEGLGGAREVDVIEEAGELGGCVGWMRRGEGGHCVEGLDWGMGADNAGVGGRSRKGPWRR